jgi:CO/xanthine dehydrogenase FAD-binding subunit
LRNEIFVPRTEDELFEFLEENGHQSRLVSGATDLLPRVWRGQEKPVTLVDVSRLVALRYIRKEQGIIRIGALSTLSDLTKNKLLGNQYEAFRKLGLIFGSPPVRNLATVGGNLAASSSSEDLIPILLALDAKVNLKSKTTYREIPLEEFIRGKRTTTIMSNELLAEVSFSELKSGSWCTFDKVGRRERMIISLVSLACVLTLNHSSRTVADVKLALNRVRGKIPERVRETEKILRGSSLDEFKLDEACKTLESELRLTSDFRASEEYRTKVAQNFLQDSLRHCQERIERERESAA